ncbi:hypothetical protein [Oligoflexus tunisiensis]|uniref:hypothetical protein n=1 Tax=Oligoflexus tunisiensis TaxID=708132 RepID=UPI00114CD37A|nr:hypothetical protein [Oligoflexus tunisiensis]
MMHVPRSLKWLFAPIILTACTVKSPVHARMSGVYDFTHPTPYYLVVFGRKPKNFMADYPYLVMPYDTSKDFAPFAKPEFHEIREVMKLKVDYYVYDFAVDSGGEFYLATEITGGRKMTIPKAFEKYLREAGK